MKQFVIDSKVFDLLPDYCVGLVIADGVDNHMHIAEIEHLLDENTQSF